MWCSLAVGNIVLIFATVISVSMGVGLVNDVSCSCCCCNICWWFFIKLPRRGVWGDERDKDDISCEDTKPLSKHQCRKESAIDPIKISIDWETLNGMKRRSTRGRDAFKGTWYLRPCDFGDWFSSRVLDWHWQTVLGSFGTLGPDNSEWGTLEHFSLGIRANSTSFLPDYWFDTEIRANINNSGGSTNILTCIGNTCCLYFVLGSSHVVVFSIKLIKYLRELMIWWKSSINIYAEGCINFGGSHVWYEFRRKNFEFVYHFTLASFEAQLTVFLFADQLRSPSQEDQNLDLSFYTIVAKKLRYQKDISQYFWIQQT